MSKFQNPTKVITGVKTRWSYANVWEAKSINGGTPKFSVSLIIPKTDTKTIDAMYTYSATNLRLQELSLGYDVPITKYVNWIKGLNLSFVAHNLWMLYNKAPFDPELTSNTGTYYQGVDYFMQPSLRNLGFSVKVKF